MPNQSAQLLKLFYETGDKVALGEFFLNNFDLIYRIAFHYTKNKNDAEDVCQQVIVRVMETNSKCDGIREESDQSVLGWLSILTANQAKMFLRTNKRNLKRDKKKGAELQMEKTDNTLLKSDGSSEDKGAVEQALTEIPEQYKSAILLRYYDNLPYNEIAKILGLREVTIRSYVSRGIDQLRLILNKRASATYSSAMIVSLIANCNISASSGVDKANLIGKVVNSTNSQRLLIRNRSRTSSFSTAKFCFIFAFILSIVFIGFNFLAKEKPLNVTTNEAFIKPAIFTKKWDFSVDHADDIKLINGSLLRNRSEGSVISTDNQDIEVELPFNFLNYYKLEVDSIFFQGTPKNNRHFMFQPDAEFCTPKLLSKETFMTLNENSFSSKRPNSQGRLYFDVNYKYYYIDEYLIFVVNDHSKPYLVKLDGSLNKAFRLHIRNLEISKIKYQPISVDDFNDLNSIMISLKENMKDSNQLQEVQKKLSAFLNASSKSLIRREY